MFFQAFERLLLIDPQSPLRGTGSVRGEIDSDCAAVEVPVPGYLISSETLESSQAI